MLTSDDIEKVQRTFGKVALIKEAAAQQFYNRLFELDPSLRPLFKGDMRQQGEKLMLTLATAIRNLKNPDAILDSIKKMGSRHAGYGVSEAHYTTVANALIWTLEKNLGTDFTPDVKAAWVKTYTFAADTMKQGAKHAA